MGPPPAGIVEVGRAATGEVFEVVARVTSCHRDWLSGTLVERSAEGTYHNTSAELSLARPEGVPIFMGTADDIVPAAVVQAQVRVDADGHLVCRRIAVLTRYVELR